MPRVNPLESATTREVADAFGLKVESVHAWREQVPEGADGCWWWESKKGNGKIRWHLPRLIEWRVKRATEGAATKVGPAPVKALDPLQEEQLRKLKRENDEREGRLVNKAELVKQWGRVGADMRQELESVGRRHGHVVANDIARALAKLQQGVHGVMGTTP